MDCDNRIPPLGLMPRYIHEDKRIADILNAMKRYSEAGYAIPCEWVLELRDLFRSRFGGDIV